MAITRAIEELHRMVGTANLDELDDLENPVAAVFQLENINTPDEMRRIVQKLLVWLNNPEQDGLRRSFAMWLSKVLIPKQMPMENIPEVSTLKEVDAMLAETVQSWYDKAAAEGEARGKARGFGKGKSWRP